MAQVLIATEDAALYYVLSAECEGEGHTALWAAQGHEAYQMALTEAPDLVFLDVALAYFNGYELCEMLRADPHVPGGLPIFLLADDYLNPQVLSRIRATGMFSKTHSAHEIRELLAEHLQHVDRLERERAVLAIRP